MSEAVKVVVKCRPMSRREKELECRHVVDVDPATGQCSISRDADAPPKVFTFDGAYDGDATNDQLYLDIAFPLVEGVTEGYNGTIFAYGQTGGGKTFTMQALIFHLHDTQLLLLLRVQAKKASGRNLSRSSVAVRVTRV